MSEIVYFPQATALLKAARARGCTTVDGGTVAVGQAIGAFGLFAGFNAGAVRVEARHQRLLAGRAGQ